MKPSRFAHYLIAFVADQLDCPSALCYDHNHARAHRGPFSAQSGHGCHKREDRREEGRLQHSNGGEKLS